MYLHPRVQGSNSRNSLRLGSFDRHTLLIDRQFLSFPYHLTFSQLSRVIPNVYTPSPIADISELSFFCLCFFNQLPSNESDYDRYIADTDIDLMRTAAAENVL